MKGAHALEPPKEPRLDAGNKHHDHCVCPPSEVARDGKLMRETL